MKVLPSLHLWLVVMVQLLSVAAIAHDSRPVFIRVESAVSGDVLLAWKVPDSVSADDAPFISLSANCAPLQDEVVLDEGGRQKVPQHSLQGMRWYQCGRPGMPESVALQWPGSVPSLATLVRIESAGRSPHTVHAGPGERLVPLPADPGASGIVLQYLTLGIEHILTGYDHLLFVACLVLLAGTFKRIALAVTGFTLAHSVTLVGAALDVVRLPIPPVEAVIALSIVFQAAELARDRRDTLTWRQPLVVASVFGLLHGFGFAAVLGEIGLPEGEVAAALFAFNLGVEAGQLAFVCVLMVALSALRRMMGDVTDADSRPRLMQRFAAYPIGTLAMFWTIDRLSGFLV